MFNLDSISWFQTHRQKLLSIRVSPLVPHILLSEAFSEVLGGTGKFFLVFVVVAKIGLFPKLLASRFTVLSADACFVDDSLVPQCLKLSVLCNLLTWEQCWAAMRHNLTWPPLRTILWGMVSLPLRSTSPTCSLRLLLAFEAYQNGPP